MNSDLAGHRNQSWTDEKHGHFLNSMEECFVRTMLETNLRLDRHLPDSSESTLDGKHNANTRKKHASSVERIGTTRSKIMKVRSNKISSSSSRRPSPQPQPQDSSSSQDQVVPQIQDRDTR